MIWKPEIIRDRYSFLHALQQAEESLLNEFEERPGDPVPGFWNGLHRSCVEGDCPVEKWAALAGVVDDWFIQVLRDTLKRWLEQPAHGGCRLQPGYQWFMYGEQIPVSPFAPTFDQPYPLSNGYFVPESIITDLDRQKRVEITQSQRIETADEFGARMRRQFEEQLAAHKKYIRHFSRQGDNRDQRRDHARWTALLFSRRATIARIAEGPTLGKNKDAYSTVHKAVQRFARDIGLSLPKQSWAKS